MVAASRPFAEHNAIEAVAFVVVFARDFTPREAEFLLSLEASLKDELPAVLRVNDMVINIVDGPNASPMSSQGQQLTGILLQHFREDGRPDWALRATGNRVIVNCWKYTRWNEVWPKARRFLLAALNLVAADSNGIAQTGLQVVDKFIYDKLPGPEDYTIGEIFRDECPYLTQQARAAGQLWHVNQGWFGESTVKDIYGGRTLHVLNLASGAIGQTQLVTTIDHLAQTDFAGNVLPVSAMTSPARSDRSGALVDDLFTWKHKVNRTVLLASLTDAKRQAIGLEP